MSNVLYIFIVGTSFMYDLNSCLSAKRMCAAFVLQWQTTTIIPVASSLSSVPTDSVRNLTAQIFSSTAIIVSWDPPLEPNGRPYYLLTLQEAGIPPDVSNQGAPVVNKTTKHSTTDTVFLFTKLRKFFPYVLTVTPATSAGPANNHTRIMYLRTDDDSEFIHMGTCREDSLCFLLRDLCVFPISSKFCSIAGVHQKSFFIFHRGSVAAPPRGKWGNNRVSPHLVWPWGLKYESHVHNLIHPDQPTSVYSLQPQYHSRNS